MIIGVTRINHLSGLDGAFQYKFPEQSNGSLVELYSPGKNKPALQNLWGDENWSKNLITLGNVKLTNWVDTESDHHITISSYFDKNETGNGFYWNIYRKHGSRPASEFMRRYFFNVYDPSNEKFTYDD